MHKDNQYEYYKVTVAVGTRMTNDKVSETCESAGMKPVCHGPTRTCSHDDLATRPTGVMLHPSPTTVGLPCKQYNNNHEQIDYRFIDRTGYR